jgi:hypothetical protein
MIICRLDKGVLPAGDQKLTWRAGSVENFAPRGLYFYRCISGKEIFTGKLMLIN